MKNRKKLAAAGIAILLCVFALFLFSPQKVDLLLIETVPYDSGAAGILSLSAWWAQAGEQGGNNPSNAQIEGFGLTERLNRIREENDQKFGTKGSIVISWGYPLAGLQYRRVRIDQGGVYLGSEGYVTDALFQEQPRQDLIYIYYIKDGVKLMDSHSADFAYEVKFAS